VPGQRAVSDIVGWLRAADNPGKLAGAAFLVSESLALTCAHVVRDHLGLGEPTPLQLPTQHVKLRFDWLGREVDAQVAPSGWWPDSGDGEIRDVAVLILSEPLSDVLCPGLAIVPPPPDLHCDVYGGTGNYPPYGQTVKSQLTADPNNLGWRQLDARTGQESGYIVRRGFSGSPILDPLRTTVWGMVATVETEPGTRVAFAIAIEHLRQATRIVAAEARQRHAPVAPATERSPDPMDQLGREALEALVGDAVPRGADGREVAPERIEELRDLVRSLVEAARAATARQHPEQADEPSPSRARIAHALEALAAGDSEQAEGLLSEVVERREADGTAAQAQAAEAYAEAAEAARHLGALAYDRDTRKAIGAYQTATRLEPDHTWSWIFLGRLQAQAGALTGAEEAYRHALKAAELAESERDVLVVSIDLGDVEVAKGDLARALQAYRRSFEIAERQAAADPGNAGCQFELGISNERGGDVLMAQGKLADALSAYERKHQAIAALVNQDPGNAGWQRDLSVSQEKIGDVLRAQGNLAQALESYRASLAIRERLAAADPGNAGWQRDLALSYGRIAAIDALQGDREGALVSFGKGRALIFRLCEASPDHAILASDLAWFDAEIAKLGG
jgi:tetratricopeptide (TPR) repeat protein